MPGCGVRFKCSINSKFVQDDAWHQGENLQLPVHMFMHLGRERDSGSSLHACLYAGMTTQCQWRLLAARGLLAPLQLRHCFWASSSQVCSSCPCATLHKISSSTLVTHQLLPALPTLLVSPVCQQHLSSRRAAVACSALPNVAGALGGVLLQHFCPDNGERCEGGEKPPPIPTAITCDGKDLWGIIGVLTCISPLCILIFQKYLRPAPPWTPEEQQDPDTGHIFMAPVHPDSPTVQIVQHAAPAHQTALEHQLSAIDPVRAEDL